MRADEGTDPVLVSRAALVGLGELGGGALAHGALPTAAAELARVGAAVGRLLTSDWEPLAIALAAPMGIGRIRLRTPEGEARAESWMAARATVVAHDVGGGQLRLVARPGADALPILLARLLGLAERPDPSAPSGPVRLRCEVSWRSAEAPPTDPRSEGGSPGVAQRHDIEVSRDVAGCWSRAGGRVAADRGEVLDELLTLVPPLGGDDVGMRRIIRPDLGVSLPVPVSWRPRVTPGGLHWLTGPAADRGPDGGGWPSFAITVGPAPAIDDPLRSGTIVTRDPVTVAGSSAVRSLSITRDGTRYGTRERLARRWELAHGPGHGPLTITATAAPAWAARHLATATTVVDGIRRLGGDDTGAPSGRVTAS